MATPKPSRPLYAEFLARVIKIEAMQRYRAAVTDDHTAQFFPRAAAPGCSATSIGPWTPRRLSPGADCDVPRNHPFRSHATRVGRGGRGVERFIAALANGELIASGMHPATGVRSEIDPAEWHVLG